MKNLICIVRSWSVIFCVAAFAWVSAVGQVVNPRQDVEPDGRDRTFNLYLFNNSDRAVTYVVRSAGWACCDSPLRQEVYGPIQPGGRVTVWIARVQGNNCDGKQGTFSLSTSDFGGLDVQMFTFSNDGYIGLANTPNRFSGGLSRKNPGDGSFTYTISTLADSPRLKRPVDERLTKPRNYIAYDSGAWARLDSQTTAKIDKLRFSQNGFWPVWFETCFGQPLFHPQHMKRLPNKDGKAYFVISGSRSHNGYLTLVETNPGVLDPVTDLVRPSADGSPVGKIIWQDVYTGVFNETYSPIGNWNHPAKIVVMGGVMIVVAQNWSEDVGIDGCTGSTSNPYQRGTSEDAIMFYDVRDPAHPVYWGIMTAEDLKLPLRERDNGLIDSFDARLISALRLFYHAHRGVWEITVGGGGNWREDYTTWETQTISPNIEDWTLVGGADSGQPPRVRTSEGSEHGDDFDSYQWDSERAIAIPANGQIRSMVFAATNNGAGGGEYDGFTFWSLLNEGIMEPTGSKEAPNMGSLGRDRDWVAESVYISRKGEPVAYTAENDNDPSGGSDDGDAYLWQVYDTRNFAVNHKSHPVSTVAVNAQDSGLGSLREAMAYGGRITFAPDLSGATIRLTSGPLIAYLQDLDIDASSLPAGLTLSGNGLSSVFEVEPGVKATLRGVSIQDGAQGPSSIPFLYAITNRGILELHDSAVHDNLYGGLTSQSGSVLLVNCTFTRNAHLNAVSNAEGSTMTLRHCTVVGNVNEFDRWGVFNRGQMTMENSIVAGNQNINGSANISGGYTDAGANLVGGDPRLAPLGRNGGRVAIMEPMSDSPAIDAAAASNVSADAVGRARPIGGAPDPGAAEAVVVKVTSSSSLEHFPLFGQALTWSALAGAEFEVFLDSGSGFVSLGRTSSTSFALPELITNRNYQWRVDVTLNGRTFPGKIQAFTTRGPLVVTTLADENDPLPRQGTGESLREALREASPGELIRFAPNLAGGSIWLDGNPLAISRSVTIDGAALSSRLTIDALGQSRVFEITGPHNVVLKGVRIVNGSAPSGAGVHNDGGTLTLTECELVENESPGQGGGVFNANGGTITVSGSTLFDRNLAREGGAIHNAAGGSLTVNGATFLRNQAFDGGGIYHQGASLSVKVASFSGNGAENAGGGILIGANPGLVENATFTQNSSAAGEGGAVSNQGQADLILRHCTIAANVGTGVFNAVGASLTLDNSILSGNFDLNNGPFELQGSYTAVGANLVRSSTGNTLLAGPTPISGDPLLGSYLSGIMQLLVGSPAIDGGVVTGNTPSTDQSRSSRPFGPAPDLGAVESRLSADVNLLWLTTSAGPLTPGFETSTTQYSAEVPATELTAAVRAAKVQGGQTLAVRMNGGEFATFGDREASPDMPLSPGENNMEVRVTSASGTVNRIYSILVIRGALSSENTGLASLSTSAGSLSPAFDFRTGVYHVTTPNSTDSATVTAAPARPDSRVELRTDSGDFVPLVSGSASESIPLHAGTNPIDLRVMGEGDSVAAFYTIMVNRQAPAQANADLDSLSLSAGELVPGFASGNLFYQLSVPAAVGTTTLTPVASQSGGAIQVRVNDGPFLQTPSGTATAALALITGENVIETRVIATDGVTVRSYIVVVTRRDEQIEWVSSPGNNDSFTPAVSADGRFVAYSSRASNLVPDDTNNTDDVFVHDRTTGTIERVSVSNSGAQGNFQSVHPSISADGRFVAFESEATNLVPNDTNGQTDRSAGVDIFVYDRTTRTMERASLTENGSQVNRASRNPSISGDGRYIAFSSGGNNLISGFRSGEVNVYVRDRIDGTIVGVSVPFSIVPSNRASLNPVISQDGNFVAFEFSVSLNDGNRSFKYRDIYLFNRVTRAVERITGSKAGREADGTESELPAISGDGRYVVFQSKSEDLDFYDVNAKRDIFLYDRLTGVTRRISASPSGVEQLFEDSIHPAISGDGRFVAFQSRIANFVEPDTNGSIDVFVKDLLTGRMMLKSGAPGGTGGNGDATLPALSGDGQVVAFLSRSSNLGTGDDSFRSHVFASVTGLAGISTLGELASLTTSAGPLNPASSPRVTNYSLDVSSGIGTATIRPVPANPGMTLSIQVNSGGFNPIGPDPVRISLIEGSNQIGIRTTAANGSSGLSYQLTIRRAASDNARLAGLELTASNEIISLSPGFSPDTGNYTATVSNETRTLRANPAVDHPSATVKVNGTSPGADAFSGPIALSVGENTIQIEVTAGNLSTIKNYTVRVTRAPSSNADLVNLTPSPAPVSGRLPFNSNRTDYTMTVDNGVSSLTFTPEASHVAAQITLNGQAVQSGSTSGAQNLVVGSNPITLLVRAEDGATTKEYFVNVIRADMAPVLGNNADLAALIPSAGVLNPGFNPGILAYTLTVPNETSVLSLTPVSADFNAVITVNELPAASGSATAPISLAVGENRLIVSVVSEDGLVSKAYQVAVTRAGSSTSIAISQSNGVIILQYVGTLESATNVNGPYNEVVGASSPRAVIAQDSNQFFRVR